MPRGRDRYETEPDAAPEPSPEQRRLSHQDSDSETVPLRERLRNLVLKPAESDTVHTAETPRGPQSVAEL
jgi:hypothetical protein